VTEGQKTLTDIPIQWLEWYRCNY